MNVRNIFQINFMLHEYYCAGSNNTAPQQCISVCKIEWTKKHVVFMVGLHGGRTVVLPRILRKHYQRNLLVYPWVLAADRIHRSLEDPGNPRATIWLFPPPHQLMPVDWDSVTVP